MRTYDGFKNYLTPKSIAKLTFPWFFAINIQFITSSLEVFLFLYREPFYNNLSAAAINLTAIERFPI